MTKKTICTEIYAEKVNGATWKFGRRIVLGKPNVCGHPNQPMDDVKKWIISERIMAQTLGHARAQKCFVDNQEFVEVFKGKDKRDHFLNMGKILSGNSPPYYLNLSTKIAKKLGMLNNVWKISCLCCRVLKGKIMHMYPRAT